MIRKLKTNHEFIGQPGTSKDPLSEPALAVSGLREDERNFLQEHINSHLQRILLSPDTDVDEYIRTYLYLKDRGIEVDVSLAKEKTVAQIYINMSANDHHKDRAKINAYIEVFGARKMIKVFELFIKVDPSQGATMIDNAPRKIINESHFLKAKWLLNDLVV